MLNRIKQLFAIAAPVSGNAATRPVASASAATIENLEDRRLMAASFDLAININDASTPVMQKGIPVMRALGVKSVRIWISTDFSSKSWTTGMQRAVDYANAGFDVMAAVVPRYGNNHAYSSIKSWFQWALGTPLKGAVDRWQVGNEPDREEYWKGTPVSYVSKLLKPASEALRAAGEPVVSAGPSWNPEDVQDMIDAGMLGMVDYVGYHPYGTTSYIPKHLAHINRVVAGRKPLVASEWNVRGLSGSAWSDAVRQVAPQVRGAFAINYYFALVQKPGSMAGPGGIMKYDGAKTSFYHALAATRYQTVPVGSTPSTSTTVAPKITALQLVNASTGQVISGYSSITSSKSISLSSLPTRNIAVVALANSGTQSVRLSAFGKTITENSAPYRTGAWYANKGSYSVSATAYSKDNLAGTKGNTISLTLTFT